SGPGSYSNGSRGLSGAVVAHPLTMHQPPHLKSEAAPARQRFNRRMAAPRRRPPRTISCCRWLETAWRYATTASDGIRFNRSGGVDDFSRLSALGEERQLDPKIGLSAPGQTQTRAEHQEM